MSTSRNTLKQFVQKVLEEQDVPYMGKFNEILSQVPEWTFDTESWIKDLTRSGFRADIQSQNRYDPTSIRILFLEDSMSWVAKIENINLDIQTSGFGDMKGALRDAALEYQQKVRSGKSSIDTLIRVLRSTQ
mgnify:CR=1 FL=1